jgi:hypothetical protein
MGEFTQNLLKLTEFPFSYSLMGLLVLIFGQDTSPEDFSLDKFGPLLILTGFVATTLSICDPVGAAQRLIIKGQGRRFIPTTVDKLMEERIFRRKISELFRLPYIVAIGYSPDDAKKFDKRPQHLVSLTTQLLKGLKQQAVKTKWITAEIDRITALVYFITIISLFIVTTQIYPVFLQNFSRIFEDIESTKLGILAFSLSALIAVSLMFILRIKSLLGKAVTVFLYLTALNAIKTEKESLKTTLQDIECYLNDNDWTLAEYWVRRLRDEYTELFVERTESPKITGTRPLKDEVNIDVSTPIVAIFNRPMQQETITRNTFTLKKEGEEGFYVGIKVDVRFENHVTAILQPIDKLDKGTKYVVTIAKDVEDFMRIKMASDETWSFTTRNT